MLIKETKHDVLNIREYDEHGSTRTMYDYDGHTSVRCWYATNEDGEIGIVGFDSSTPHSCTYHQKNRGSVIVYPSHPRYAEFPFPEVEVEPSPSDQDPVLGKVVASWDVSEFLSEDPF